MIYFFFGSLKIIINFCLSKKVEVEVESLDKNGAFIGSLVTKNGANLSALLLEQGLGYLNTTSADQSTNVNLYYSAETRAKANKKNVKLASLCS